METSGYRLDRIAPLSIEAESVGLAGQMMSADLVTKEDGQAARRALRGPAERPPLG